MLAAGSEVVIENLVFLNGKFNTCWKVWVLMLAAGSEVLIGKISTASRALSSDQPRRVPPAVLSGGSWPSRYAKFLWMTSRSWENRSSITQSFVCPYRWVPHDGYIRHQNDHLSGRMTDISVMGEWQVAGVGGTRPLWNVLGEAIEGRFSFEARNYLFSFQSYVRFEEFFCFPRFWKIWRQMFKLWGFWFRQCFGALFENSAPSSGIFLRALTTTSISWKFPFFFSKAEPVLLVWQVWRSQVWANHFGGGTSKTRMKTRLPGVGEIERRRTINRRRDWYESCAMIHGPEERKKKKRKEVSVWLCEGSTVHHLQIGLIT